VLAEPKYGEPKQAAYQYGEKTFYVYVDKMCNGVHYGEPLPEFAAIVQEFTELALGVRSVQQKSTRRLAPQNRPY
jgi:hypothetical protein